MTLFWNVLQSIITVFEIRVCVWMMENFAEPRFRRKKQKAAVWFVSLGVGGVYAANRWITTYYSRLMIIAGVILLSLAAVGLFIYHRRIAIFVCANYLLAGGLLDLSIMSGAEIIAQSPGMFDHIMGVNDGRRLVIMVLSKFLLGIACWMICRRIDRAVVYHLPRIRIWVIGCTICVTEYLGINILTEILSANAGITHDFLTSSIFYLVIILLMLIAVSIIILYYDKKDQLKQKNMLMESLNYENQRLIRLYRERETLYHDFKNHLLTLDSWVQRGDLKEYHAYMERIRKPFLERPAERRTGHEVIDLILNHKVGEAEKSGIRVNCEILGYIDFKLDMTDEDACSLMGNLWDNAIEACRRIQSGEKWIDFRLRIRPGKLLLEITNSCLEVCRDMNGGLATMKKDKSFHGIGVRTIRNITERYGGYFNYVFNDHSFKVEVMICNK